MTAITIIVIILVAAVEAYLLNFEIKRRKTEVGNLRAELAKKKTEAVIETAKDTTVQTVAEAQKEADAVVEKVKDAKTTTETVKIANELFPGG